MTLIANPPQRGPKPSHSVARTSVLLAASHIILIVTALGFWAVSARLFDVDEYNDGLVLINAIMLIGGVAKLNGHISLPAVLARRGRDATELLTNTLVGTAALSALGGLVYVAIERLWANDLPTPGLALLVVPVGCAAWTIFTLQDGALAGIGRSDLVPVENVLYGIARFVVLVVVATWATGRTAMFVGWVAPLLIAIPAVLAFVYRRALPWFVGDSAEFSEDRAVVKADAFGSLFSQALFRLLPVIAILILGDENNLAALTTAWLVFTVSDTFLSTIGTSLAISNPAEREHHAGQAYRLGGVMTLGLAGGFVVFAPLIMAILAPDFGSNGVGLLRLIGVALLFRAPLHLALAEARMLGAAMRLFLLQLASGVALIIAIGASLFTEDLMLIGIGLVLATVAAVPYSLHALRNPIGPQARPTPAPVAVR